MQEENQTTKKAALLLLPNLLGAVPHISMVLPASVERAVATLDGLISESPTAGRRFLSHFSTKKPLHEMPIACYDVKTPDEDIDFFLQPIRNGERWGFVCDAGLPCIADPGYKLVARARSSGISVQAFSGPSSIMQALMLSGLPGDHFAFHGYLPKEEKERAKSLKELEKQSKRGGTQIFIETPYRNLPLLTAALQLLQPHTMLCVAWDLTMPTQGVICQSVDGWKLIPQPSLSKKPAIFLLLQP